MSTVQQGGVFSQSAADVCKQAPLSDAARVHLEKKPTVGQFISVLTEHGLSLDACRALAFALPKRETIWWACQCLRQAKLAGSPLELAALEAAERWVAAPDDERRRSAQAASEAAGVGTPAGCVALATFLSGGSLAPPTVAEVPPAEHLTAAAITGALAIAAVEKNPAQSVEQCQRFFAIALEVVNRKNCWPGWQPSGLLVGSS
jgi:hypothetical protein